MKLESTRTVGEIAAEMPAATRVFEKFGIDYCCGGKRSLTDACASAGISLDSLAQRLAEVAQGNRPADHDWRTAPLADLVGHITSTHHAFVRAEIPRLTALAAKVVGVHGKNHPELAEVQQVFAGVAQELTMHLTKEEQILFPAIVQMEQARAAGQPLGKLGCFGTVQNPIRVMIYEHDSAGDAFAKLHEISGDFAVPPDACISYRTLYNALLEFEADLHQHIHLENNILFPRAIELEQRATT